MHYGFLLDWHCHWLSILWPSFALLSSSNVSCDIALFSVLRYIGVVSHGIGTGRTMVSRRIPIAVSSHSVNLQLVCPT